MLNHIIFLRIIWQGGRALLDIRCYSGVQMSSPSSFFPQLVLLSTHGLEHPFGQLGLLSWLCPLPVPCAASLLAGQPEKQERPWCCLCPAQQLLNHPCVISPVHHKSKTHPCTSHYDGISSAPAKVSMAFT